MTPAGQRWTRSKPTEPGWYWFRETWIGSEIVCVEQPHGPDTDYLEVWDGPLDMFHSEGCEWQGPLTPNEATE